MKTKALHIDCMEYMKGMEDNAFDLAIVDPEYGIGEGKNHAKRTNKVKQKNGSILTIEKKHAKKDWDDKPAGKDYFSELFRVSKNQIIFGANYFTEFIPPSMGWIIWDKVNSGDFSDCELIYTSFQRANRIIPYMWNGMNQGRSINKGRIAQGNKSLNEKRIHPSQKPVRLYKWIIENYCKSGSKILDTHLGSGSSRIAAADLNFEFIGCEKDREYFDLHQQRFSEYEAKKKREISMFQ